MNIGFDFDDVVAHTHLLKPMLAQILFGVQISAENFQKEYVLGRGLLTVEQYRRIGEEAFSGRYPLAPVPDSLEYLSRLSRERHFLRIISSRSSTQGNLKPAKAWLREQGLDLPFAGVGYGNSKAEACQGLDLFVDDDLVKLLPLIGRVPHLLLFTWPHKVCESKPDGITLVRSWGGIYQYVCRVSK